ncbi:uncharacterized protein LOC118437079 isoform X1 [Folsomia candida]|uniref:uncharacterized protein LOC118437079 isoform X1 n=1 Tax=Folsomia candida TaxID=158441 RepID=UPI001604FF71|nr:uncharacterized protein LOC118437079 isoform X1 [Folsomia candida]
MKMNLPKLTSFTKYAFRTLQTVPIVLYKAKYTEEVIVSRDTWATACLTYNTEKCTALLCQEILTSADCNGTDGVPAYKKYGILNGVGLTINKANDFCLSPANIADAMLWPTQEAKEERKRVSNLIDKFKLNEYKTGKPEESEDASCPKDALSKDILSKFQEIYLEALETSLFKNSIEIFEYLIRAFHEDRYLFVGGVSINSKDYCNAYLSQSDIAEVTNVVMTSIENDLGNEYTREWRTSPTLKLITYQCAGHMRGQPAKMFIDSAKSGERAFLTEAEINQLETSIFGSRHEAVVIST